MIGFLVELFSQVGFLSCVAKFSSSVSENLKVNLLNERSFIELIFQKVLPCITFLKIFCISTQF